METIKLIGRSSRLSLLQIDIVRQKIQSAFPNLKVDVVARSSKGDALLDIPLHTVEGSDFFTQDIFDALTIGEADIAVHSLKDMSSEHFFGENKFVVVDRDDRRDVAIFNDDIEERVKNGETIIIGTCSPRREEMATVFLKKALPQLNREIKIKTKDIRGNVETRLRKLNSGEYDATILATAGINRLLRSGEDADLIKELLADKKLMLLPLVECVPAPCQGAIVAEAHSSNVKAIEVLNKINDVGLFADCYAEKKEAVKYGAGCIQKFGVTTLITKNGKYLYAAGKDSEGTEFVKWDPLPELKINDSLFSSTDVMAGFFDYEWSKEEIAIDKPVVFVANYKAIQGKSEVKDLSGKKIIASGTKTWLELSKKGYWVTASADALGFEFLLSSLNMPLLDINAEDISILTHETAAERWRIKGYDAVSNYKLVPKNDKGIQQSIAAADAIFWTSFSQYEFYGKYAKPDVKHLCAGGETAELLKQEGLELVIFPTIKAFEQWRKYSIQSRSVA
ncbi:MAG TPA: hydroxymethylbilane synthase [Chitinophagaceae bacterium]|nr:hydroxymethylbilane synthase [Chitinophagaceae bacterium]